MSKEIYFRASGVGALMTDKRGSVITQTQLKKIATLETKVREGGKLTENQKVELKDLKIKREKPFELSDTAKAFVNDIWLLTNKGYYKDIKSKYLDKGIFGEEVGMNLLSDLDGRFYTKNTKRINKDNFTGECDSNFKLEEKKIIQDIKCCWDAKTFIDAKMSTDNEWQGRTYMELYDADEFWLRFCLVDCPEHIVIKEKEYLWRKYQSDSMDDEQRHDLEERLEPLYDQIERNLVYSTNPAYKKEEMVKTIKITRDKAKFKELQDRIPSALKYYDTIKLNKIV